MPDLIAADIYDYFLQRKPLQVNANPNVAEYIVNLQKNKEERAKKATAKLRDRQSVTPPSFELKVYTGTYKNDELGQIVISIEGSSLTARFGNLDSSLTPVNGDSFEGSFSFGDADLTFRADKNTGVSELTMLGKTFVRVQ